jgi:hypothetical protein
MVAKISSGNSLYGVLSYNQIKVDEDHAKVIFAGRMIENADGKFDIHSCLQSFEPYLLANKRTEKPVLHISINPDPKDVLNAEQLSEIAQIYMQKMGYGDQPFIVYMHEDIERRHIHIISIRVDENGKKIDHNFEHRRSMNICRELEQKYGLIPHRPPKSIMMGFLFSLSIHRSIKELRIICYHPILFFEIQKLSILLYSISKEKCNETDISTENCFD